MNWEFIHYTPCYFVFVDNCSDLQSKTARRLPNSTTCGIYRATVCGAAWVTSAHSAGADFRDIKKQGGWRRDGTVQGYIEETSRYEENTAGSLLRTRVTPA